MDFNDEIQTLTNRLRALFFALTLPILPLGAILLLLIFQLLSNALASPSCGTGHPLKLYSFFTLLMSIYTPNHKAMRSWLFDYDRNRDGNARPRIVRIYDHCYHIICVLFVYYGMTIIQSCQENTVDVSIHTIEILTPTSAADTTTTIANDSSHIQGTTNETAIQESVCAVSCPEFYASMQRFVFVLKIFFIVLLLPLVCLPFIYLWIVRRLNTEEAWLRFGRAVNSNSDGDERTVYAKDIMKGLKSVVLVPVVLGQEQGKATSTGTSTTKSGFQRVKIVEKKWSNSQENENDDNTNESSSGGDEEEQQLGQQQEADTRDWDAVKDCCICMSEFDVDGFTDTDNNNDDSNNENTECSLIPPNPDVASVMRGKEIVKTKCGHLFHRECIGSWIGGNWVAENIVNNGVVRATRRRCPLCREDLSPPVNDD